MEDQNLQSDSSGLTCASDAEAIRYMEQAVKGGQHWYIALLEAIQLWTSAEEVHNGRTYRYLIGEEALDWLLLAERLCSAVDGLLPDDEMTALLFHGKPPLNITKKEFRSLIGSVKCHQCLNYFYGVIVEEALLLAVQQEVRKEWRTLGSANDWDTTNEVYRRIYGATKAPLLKRFRREKGYPQARSMSLSTLKEFTYWLFAYRLENCDKTRVASDTKKALKQLSTMGFSQPW